MTTLRSRRFRFPFKGFQNLRAKQNCLCHRIIINDIFDVVSEIVVRIVVVTTSVVNDHDNEEKGEKKL